MVRVATVRVAWWPLFRYVRHAHCSVRGVYRMGAAAMPCALLLRTARRAVGVIGWLAGRSVVDSVVVVVVDAQDRRVCRRATRRETCRMLRSVQRVAQCCNGLRCVALGLHRAATWRQLQAQCGLPTGWMSCRCWSAHQPHVRNARRGKGRAQSRCRCGGLTCLELLVCRALSEVSCKSG